MPDETIYCPECKSKVRVPDTLLGEPVTCPLCRHTFTAPVRGGGRVPAAVDSEPMSPDASAAAARVKPPAIALLVVGVLGLVADLTGFAAVLVMGPQGIAQHQQQVQQIFAIFGVPPQRVDGEHEFKKYLAFHAIMAASALGVVFGAWQMLRLRLYALAVIASFLPVFNCVSGCCLLGLPVGIWSLVVLLRPEVRSAFQ